MSKLETKSNCMVQRCTMLTRKKDAKNQGLDLDRLSIKIRCENCGANKEKVWQS